MELKEEFIELMKPFFDKRQRDWEIAEGKELVVGRIYSHLYSIEHPDDKDKIPEALTRTGARAEVLYDIYCELESKAS